MPIGTLQVDFIANIAKYIEDLGKASAQSEAAARRIERSFDSAFSLVKSKVVDLAAALGVGFSIVGIEQMISGAIEAEAALGRIGALAGVSGEEISKLSLAARLSHTDLSDLADMSAKLSKALLVSQDATTKQAAVFRALGFSSEDTARLLADPTNALFEFSKSIAGLSEGTKVAAMMVAVGRGGNQAAAALQELAKQTSLVATRSNEEIAAAKEFEDRLVQLGIKSDNLKTALGNALIGTLGDVVDAFSKLTGGAGGAKDMVDKLAADGSIQEWARDAAKVLAVVAETAIFIGRAIGVAGAAISAEAARVSAYNASVQLQNAVTFGSRPEEYAQLQRNLDQALAKQESSMIESNRRDKLLWDQRGNFISDALDKQFALSDAQRKAVVDFPVNADANDRRNSAALDAQAAAAAKAASARAKAVQDAVAGVNRRANAGEDPTKKILETQIAALNAAIKEEEAILSLHALFLDEDFKHGDISIEQYYKGINDDIAKGLAVKRSAFNEEIAATEAFIATREKLLATGNKKDPGYVTAAKDIEDANKKIVTITEQLTQAEYAAAKSSVKSIGDKRAALESYGDSLKAIAADLLTLQGSTAEAERLRLDTAATQKQFRDFADIQLTGTPDKAAAAANAAKQLRDTIDLKIAQAGLNDTARDFSTINDQISNSVQRLNLQYQLGAITELDSLSRSSDAINAKIGLLSKEADAFDALAKKFGDSPAGLALQNQAEKLRLNIEQLIVQADALNKKFRDIFEGASTTFLDDLINRTKTWKQAGLDAAKSIEQAITHIATTNISESLFGKTGAAGGIPDLLAKWFGGKGLGSSTASGQVAGDAFLPGALGAGGGASTAAALTLVDVPATALSISLYAAVVAVDAFAASAAAAAGASAASAGGGYASALAAAVASGGSFAVGTDYVPHDMIAQIHQGERIIPAAQNRGAKAGNVVNMGGIHINVLPGATRQSADQAAAAVGMEIRRATARIL